MNERERWREEHARAAREVEARLRDTFAAMEQWCDAEPTLLDFRPAPERWSAREILEHVTLTNHYLLVLADKIRDKSAKRLARGEPWPTGAPLHEALERLAAERTRWPHPEHMTPTGAASIDEVRARLAEQSSRALAHVDAMSSGEGTLHRIRMSRLPGENRLGLVEYLDVIARHAERHLAQLQENRSAAQDSGA